LPMNLQVGKSVFHGEGLFIVPGMGGATCRVDRRFG